MTSLPIHVCAVQYATEDGNGTASTDRALHLLDDAAHTSDLVLLPEISFTSYMPAAEMRQHAQPVRGPLTAIVSQIAVVRNACVCLCIPERDGDRVFNTAVLICADGAVIGSHRKVRLSQRDEAAGFVAGGSSSVYETYLGRFGIMISDEALEVSKAVDLAARGAQILLVPSVAVADSEGNAEALDGWEESLRRCAVESRCHVVWANKIGAAAGGDALGNSMILGPDGKIIARAGMMQEIVRAEITLRGLSRAA